MSHRLTPAHRLAVVQVERGDKKVTAIEVVWDNTPITISDEAQALPPEIDRLAKMLVQLVKEMNNDSH